VDRASKEKPTEGRNYLSFLPGSLQSYIGNRRVTTLGCLPGFIEILVQKLVKENPVVLLE